MKYIFNYSLFFLLIIYSCGSNNKQPNIEDDPDLLELTKSPKERKNEELKALGGVDSLSLIAWGDTKFGMTRQEVKASEAFKLEKQEKAAGLDLDYEDYYATGPKKGYLLKSLFHLNFTPEIKAHFKENELYLVTIETLGRNADKIEDLANDCGIFAKEFMKKYGEPDYLKTTASILDFSNHQLNIASFSIGAKEIWIGLKENDSQYKYYISIVNRSFPKKKHAPTEEELRKQKEQDAKNKELRNNSF